MFFEVWNRISEFSCLVLNKGYSLCCLMCLHYLTCTWQKPAHPLRLPAVHFQSWSGKGLSFHSHAPCIDRLFQMKETKQREQEFRQAAWNDKKCILPNTQSITISITEYNIFLHFWIITGFIRPPSPPVSKSLCWPVSFFFLVDIIFLSFSLLPHIFLCKSEKMFCHLQLSCQLKLAGVCTLGQESASFTGC